MIIRKKVRRIYEQRGDEWFTIHGLKHTIACCDCGLVHHIEIREHKGELQMRAIRDNRATGQKRRFNKYPCKLRKRKIE